MVHPRAFGDFQFQLCGGKAAVAQDLGDGIDKSVATELARRQMSGFGGMISVETGTKENAECSNRGVCNIATGQCTCSTGFYPSDGMGGPGSINDCGYVPLAALVPAPPITACPGSPTVCSGHGTCDR